MGYIHPVSISRILVACKHWRARLTERHPLKHKKDMDNGGGGGGGTPPFYALAYIMKL
jgi:hypothetical protein